MVIQSLSNFVCLFRYSADLLRQTLSRFTVGLGGNGTSRFTPFVNIFYMKCSIRSGITRKHGSPFCPVGTCYIFVWFFSLSLNTNKKLLIPYQPVKQYFPFISTVFSKVTNYSRNSLQKQLTTLDHKTRETRID